MYSRSGRRGCVLCFRYGNDACGDSLSDTPPACRAHRRVCCSTESGIRIIEDADGAGKRENLCSSGAFMDDVVDAKTSPGLRSLWAGGAFDAHGPMTLIGALGRHRDAWRCCTARTQKVDG